MFNLSDIVVASGIITSYSIAKMFASDSEIKKASIEEINRYIQ